jgi:hypothetical protein
VSDYYEFQWPDPQKPKFVTRSLTVLRGRRKSKQKPPLVLRDAKLIELVEHCLYEVPRDCHAEAVGVSELKPGCILGRNLKVSGRISGSSEDEVNQCFVSYDGVYKARRGVGHADRRYRSSEVPANKDLAGTLDELVRLAWELHKVSEDEREAYALKAVRAAEDYGKPIDGRKVAAKARTLQAGELKDSTGRFNPGRIPLICFAGKNQIAARNQAVRSIGRHMSFREAVLEHYIECLHEICFEVSRSQEHRLRDEWLAKGPARTESKVLQEAQRLADAATRLRAITVRPLSRSFGRCADDLDEAASLLRKAAQERDGNEVTKAKLVIGKVYRAMVQLECHWRLEDVLMQVSILEDNRGSISGSQRRVWHEELCAVHLRLRSPDRLTGKLLEYGFKRKVLPRVLPRIILADASLMDEPAGKELKAMMAELKLACEPF